MCTPLPLHQPFAFFFFCTYCHWMMSRCTTVGFGIAETLWRNSCFITVYFPGAFPTTFVAWRLIEDSSQCDLKCQTLIDHNFPLLMHLLPTIYILWPLALTFCSSILHSHLPPPCRQSLLCEHHHERCDRRVEVHLHRSERDPA